jgi:hypothetical protein
MIKTAAEAFSQVGSHFEFAPFEKIIQPIIDDVLKEHQKDKYRKGTILTPCILVWLCFSLALRRNSNYSKTLNWLVAGFRWKSLDFKKKSLKMARLAMLDRKWDSRFFVVFFTDFLQLSKMLRPSISTD